MTESKNKKTRSFPIPPALFIGLVIFLLPIFIIMTADRINRQKKLVQQQLMEKAVSLIRTFEAGTRTGMFNMRWGAQRIQDLLFETSLQPDVAYMMITTKQGLILAHSNESLNGKSLEKMPSLPPIDDPAKFESRIVKTADYPEGVFEVYKRFVPLHRSMGAGHMGNHRMRRFMERMNESSQTQWDEKDWSRPYHDFRDNGEDAEHYIFAGLSLKPLHQAESQLFKETMFQSLIYFLFVCAGVVAVVVFQSYRSTKASLKRMKSYSDTVIQQMPAGLITTDDSGRVTAMNQAAVEMFEKGLKRVNEPFKTVMEEIRQNGGMVTREITLDTDSGKRLLLDLNASIIQSEEPERNGFLFLFKDLTHIKELTRQLETNRRLAAIGKLAAGVAHEIRNPLSSIKGFATYFGRRYQDNPSDSETARIMVSEVERINRSITQLLEFAKPMAVENKRVELEELLAHSLKLIEPDVVQRKIEVSVDNQSRQTWIMTDGDRLNQVLLNLYMNALDALESDALESDALKADAQKEKRTIKVRVTDAEKRFIKIEVKDNGVGMDKATLDQIFEPYFTTRATGTGLGLAIVHRIIENLGGTIRAESAAGQGTCFTLKIPSGEENDR